MELEKSFNCQKQLKNLTWRCQYKFCHLFLMELTEVCLVSTGWLVLGAIIFLTLWCMLLLFGITFRKTGHSVKFAVWAWLPVSSKSSFIFFFAHDMYLEGKLQSRERYDVIIYSCNTWLYCSLTYTFPRDGTVEIVLISTSFLGFVLDNETR